MQIDTLEYQNNDAVDYNSLNKIRNCMCTLIHIFKNREEKVLFISESQKIYMEEVMMLKIIIWQVFE